MRKIFNLITIAITAAGVATASAQDFTSYKFGGMMMDHDGMMSSDFYSLSQVNFGFGTARSMAMAGAFTSLGADMSAMATNPAGLGMYRGNDISITPMLSLQSAQNSAANWAENSKTQFAFANLGASLNLYENGDSDLVSLNFAVGLNRIADFNYRYGFSSESAPSTNPYRSILDTFSRQLGQGGLFPDATGYMDYYPSDAYYWGGILGYNNFLLDVETDDLGDYWTSGGRLGNNAYVGHSASLESRGSINEFDVAMGMNLSNKLYLGFTVGLQTVDWRRQYFYGEDYNYYGETPVDADGNPLAYDPARYMEYNQAVDIDGAGVNFKLGLIYRPFESLRLGVALHTPTYYSLDRSYQAYMSSNLYPDGNTTRPLDDDGSNTWDFCSPTRLMFGASYTFGRFAIISVDYERDWYNGMRVKNIPSGFDISPEDYRTLFKNNYKGSNTLRVGAEIKPLPMLALRAGYGIADSSLRNDIDLYYNSPITYKSTCISAGVGVALGSITLDLAYQHIANKQTQYLLHYALEDTGRFDSMSPYYSTNLTRDYIILTLGLRF